MNKNKRMMKTNRKENIKEKVHKRGKGITTLVHIDFLECLGFMVHVEEVFQEDLDIMELTDIMDIMDFTDITDKITRKMKVFVNVLIV